MFRIATLLLFSISFSQAAPLPPMDATDFADKATDLFIATCVDPDLNKGKKTVRSVVSEVEVESVLKGSHTIGKTKLYSLPHSMEAGKRYLVAEFHTLPKQPAYNERSEQGFTEIPTTVDLKQLAGKTPAEQARIIFEARRDQVDALLLKLQKEKKVLEIAAPKTK